MPLHTGQTRDQETGRGLITDMGPQTRTCPDRSLHRNLTPRASKVFAMESESNTTAAGKAAGRLSACQEFCRRAGGEAGERAQSTQVPTLPPLLGKHSPACGIQAPPLRSVTRAATRAAETQAWSRPGVSILQGPSSLYLDGSEQETPTCVLRKINSPECRAGLSS